MHHKKMKVVVVVSHSYIKFSLKDKFKVTEKEINLGCYSQVTAKTPVKKKPILFSFLSSSVLLQFPFNCDLRSCFS